VNGRIIILYMPRGAIMQLKFDAEFQKLTRPLRLTWMARMWKLWKTRQPSALAKGVAAIPVPGENSSRQTRCFDDDRSPPAGGMRRNGAGRRKRSDEIRRQWLDHSASDRDAIFTARGHWKIVGRPISVISLKEFSAHEMNGAYQDISFNSVSGQELRPTARAKSDQILELDRTGLSREGIATQLGIGVASVYRVLKAARVAA